MSGGGWGAGEGGWPFGHRFRSHSCIHTLLPPLSLPHTHTHTHTFRDMHDESNKGGVHYVVVVGRGWGLKEGVKLS